MRQIDDPGVRCTAQNNALHDAHEGAFVAEIGCEGYDPEHGRIITGESLRQSLYFVAGAIPVTGPVERGRRLPSLSGLGDLTAIIF